MRTAWVLSGGGAAGSMQMGTMKALLEGGIVPDGLYGTSAGALNAFGLSFGGIVKLEALWRSIKETKDVLISNFAPLIFGSGFYNAAPLKNLLQNCRGSNSANIPFSVTSLDINESRLVVANSSYHNILDYTLASAAIPILIEPQVIDGHTLVDGGVIDNCPLREAILDGYNNIYVINCFTDAVAKATPFLLHNKLLDTGLKAIGAMRYEIMTMDMIYKDIADSGVKVQIITPENQACDVMDFNDVKISAGIEEGYRLGREFLEKVKAPL